MVSLGIVYREETWRLHWSETHQTELERHDQECLFSPRGRTGYVGRSRQSPVPVNSFENIPVHKDSCPVAKQQICLFLVHPCLRKDQSNALFAIKELQRSISFPRCPRCNFTALKVYKHIHEIRHLFLFVSTWQTELG